MATMVILYARQTFKSITCLINNLLLTSRQEILLAGRIVAN